MTAAGIFLAARRAWDLIPWQAKLALAVVLAIVAAYWYGGHIERRKCEARISASIAAARQIDIAETERSRLQAEAQARDAETRAETVKTEVARYVEELAKRTADNCVAGADADRFNAGVGVSDDAVPAARAKPPGLGRHRAQPGPVPARPRQ